MPHNVSLISTIAAGFGLALALGYIAARVKVPRLAPLPGGGAAEHAAPGQNIWATLTITLAKVGAFIALNSLPFGATEPLQACLRQRSALARLLEQEEIGKVFMGEHELAHGMAGHVLARMGRAVAAR